MIANGNSKIGNPKKEFDDYFACNQIICHDWYSSGGAHNELKLKSDLDIPIYQERSVDKTTEWHC